MYRFQRIHVIVLDSAGIGNAPDAAAFGDAGANTFLHTAQAVPQLEIPHLAQMGLSALVPFTNVALPSSYKGYYTSMAEASAGKDTMTGHWELMGLQTSVPFRVFPEGFPKPLIRQIEEFSGRKVIVNAPASGTEVIYEYGERQMKTGELIVYTSADSVLQIAAHEEVVPLAELYRICQFCRDITRSEPYAIGRIIARPYVGKDKHSFERTPNRHDYALKPTGSTVLNYLEAKGLDVVAIGKIRDIFDGEGITRAIKTKSNVDGMEKFLSLLDEEFTGLSFTNLVDFDAKYGHRRDPLGYAKALEEFDAYLPAVWEKMKDNDLLILTADHGTDPTAPGTDHTREQVPMLAYSPAFMASGLLTPRTSYADLGATIGANFEVAESLHGISFLAEMR